MSYRPNRIGPWPVLTLDDQSIQEINGAENTSASFMRDIDEPRVVLRRDTSQNPDNFTFYGWGRQVDAGKCIALGIDLGPPPETDSKYVLVQVAGAICGLSGTNICSDLIVGWVEAKGTTSSVAYRSVKRWVQLASRFGAEGVDYNGCIVLDKHNLPGTNTGSLVVAWRLSNGHSANVSGTNKQAGYISGFYYDQEIDIHQPSK